MMPEKRRSGASGSPSINKWLEKSQDGFLVNGSLMQREKRRIEGGAVNLPYC